MAVNPGGPGPAVYTKVNLSNNADDDVTRMGYIDWYGLGADSAKQTIRKGAGGEFEQNADNNGNSAGGVAYKLKEIVWIVAWENMKDQNNKVYTKISTIKSGEENINWDDVKHDVDRSTSSCTSSENGYNSTVVVPENSTTPAVTANLVHP